MGLSLSLTTSGLKKPTAQAHLNRYVGTHIMYIEDMLSSFDMRIRCCAVYKKRKTESHLCTKFKFYAHAQQVKIKRTKLQTINISSVTFYYSTAIMTPSLKSKCMKALC